MSDMAFGGGSELLMAGNDRSNVWSVLEEAMLYVRPIEVMCGERLAEQNYTRSIATFFGHMPWLGVYVGKIPAATGNLVVLINNSIQCVKARLQRGSEKKDLFHYLVCCLSSMPTAPFDDALEQRGPA